MGAGSDDDRGGGRLAALREAFTGALWPLPTAAVIAAVVLGVLLTRLTPFGESDALFGGGPDAARAVLSAIAGSLITVTSLTFSLTVVTLQLASSQFSNRLLRTFVRDRVVQGTLALFLATFAYALTVLRTIRSGEDAAAVFVPQLAVTVGYGLALLSLGGLVLFLSHLVTLLRVESMLRDVHADSTLSVNRLPAREDAPDQPEAPEAPERAVPLCARRSGFVTEVAVARLRDVAVAHSAVVLLDRAPGDPVVVGTPVGVAWTASPSAEGLDVDALASDVLATLTTGHERTLTEDPAYGLRQVADVATKALSPGVNDPTTAVHALGHLSALVCRLATRDLRPVVLSDDDGVVRAVVRRRGFPEFLELACGEVRRYGASEPRVMARLLRLLREVAWVTRDEAQRAAVRDQLRRLGAALDREIADDTDREHLRRLEGEVEGALAGRWAPALSSDG